MNKNPNVRFAKSCGAVAGLLAAATAAHASTDYGPAMWYGACNYSTSGYGKRFWVIHDIEGYYYSCLYYFARCSTQASVHYATNGKKDNGSDAAPGAMAQMVRDAYYSWTARCWNGYSLQNEHEGFASNPAWYTEAMYVASASCTKSKCNKYGIAKDRNRIIAHGQKSVSGWEAWANSQGYSDSWVRCNTHTDPGPYWKWTHYIDLVRGGGVLPPSAPSGLKATTYSSSRIDLIWTDNSGNESGFKVERKTGSGGTYAQIGTTAAGDRTYSSTGLGSGTTYYFRVRAYNAGGNSAYSGSAGATTKDTIPAAPTSLTATAVSNDQINLGWAQSMPNEDGFRIYRSTDGTNFAQVATAGINATSYSNTGLTGNRKYWYRVYAYNTAGNSAASNTASDTTAPQAPTSLTVSAVAGNANWNKLDLAWVDNAGSEVGFKIERATAVGGPYTQIATNAASDITYQNTGLSAGVTYYYRVRSYNGNGNSDYSNIASRATGNAPPLLNAIGNKTVAAGSALTFTVSGSDPNAPAPVTTVWQNFTSFPHNNPIETVLFNRPLNSGTTSSFMDTSTNYTRIQTNGPSAWGAGNKALVAGWGFKTGMANYWVRLNTYNTPTNPNPIIALDQKLQFKYYANHTTQVGLGVRETGSTAAYGANGGAVGSVEWVGVTNVVGGHPIPNTQVALATPATLVWNIPFSAQAGFTGDGKVDESGAKGVLEHVIIRGLTTGAHNAWFDDFAVVTGNNLVYTLDAGAPSGASIARRSGKFSWTPSTGQAGVHTITVRVADSLGAQDWETIQVTVTGTGNAAPVLAAIGNKTVKEGLNLAFTASATDANGNALTYTLEGNPSGSSINASSGAFSWTPTEAQGAGSYPITVRVTDNGSPVSNDFEVVTVTVQEVNVAPALAAIADQTVNEGAALNLTASGSDTDVPANALTYTLEGPTGMTINPSSGAISYTPGETDGGDVNQVTVTVKDNGSPALSVSRTFNVTVNEVNAAPSVVVGARSILSPIAAMDELDDEGLTGHNNSVLFRVPYFSSSTTAFLDSTSYSYVTNVFPTEEITNNSYQALYVQMDFKTGTTNPWCRLTTYSSSAWTNIYAYPNPTINLAGKVRLKIYSDKSIKVALGIRETATGVPYGFNGGISGQIEWVGATGTGSPVAPVPSTTVAANNWTIVDFDIPAMTKTAFPGSGNGLITAAKGTIEHLAIVPNAGSGLYTIYIDDVEVITTTSANPITIDTLDTVTLNLTSTDSDNPAQNFLYSMTAGTATNATLNAINGIFSWTAMQDASLANVVTLTTTDDGSPNLSGSQNLTINVNRVNTPPHLDRMEDQVLESGGVPMTFDAAAGDDDLPGDTLTYSITSNPGGATIDPATGAFSWTPPTGNGTYAATIRVTDNGTPPLWDEQTVNIIVTTPNTAPTLTLGTARATETVVNYETFTNGTPNEQVMFKKPGNSATTSAYIDTNVVNSTSVTTNFPAGNANAGAKVLKATWAFKTGVTDYWIRLTTGNTTLLPNPTINASARLKVDVYTTKALKVGLGIRETGTTAENGANGGTTGAIEYVGCSSQIGTTPQPTRTVNANTWTTLEFDLPAEPCQTLTGNSILAGGQQVLEHMILVGAGGTGTYDVYFDNFQVVTTTALPGTVAMKANSTLTITASATDPDPGDGLVYGLDADFADAYTNAVINETTGAFTWTPGTTEVGLTIPAGINVSDQPSDGGNAKNDSESFSVTVSADTLAPQGGNTFVAGGETVTLNWSSTAGASYAVQSKTVGASGWTTLQTVTATGDSSSVSVTNSGDDAHYRVVDSGSSDQ